MARWSRLILIAVLLCGSGAHAAQVNLNWDTDREPDAIGAEISDGVVYASVRDLASALGLETQWQASRQKLIVSAGPVVAKFTAWNSIVVVDDLPYNLPNPTLLNGGTLLAPAEELTRLLAPMVSGNLSWDPSRREFSLSTEQYNIRPGTLEQRENGTLVTIVVPGDLPIEDETSAPNWIHLTILGGHIDAQAFRHFGLGGAVQQILAYQYDNSAKLSFRLEVGHSFDMMRSEENGRLMLLFRQDMPLPTPFTQLGELVEIDRDQWSINTVVIDAGHGGRDPGAIGEDDVREKHVVLSIAQRLAGRLREDLGVEAVLTRSTDEFVSLRRRGRVATNSGGKLFISIHANTNPDSRVSGIETYFLSEAKTEEARDVARLENAAIRFEQATEAVGDTADIHWYEWEDVDEILAGMTSSRYLEESQELAKIVQDELVRSLGARDLGVRQAEFYVMKGTLASMPSILVEVGFLSNRAEVRRLRQASYQRRTADAIYRAVVEFKRRYERNL
jgi:N-acetylmuramoyl-L-alanine amidase